jgi:hypothetical protein
VAGITARTAYRRLLKKYWEWALIVRWYMIINILQHKIDDTHQDSWWYDGTIAMTDHYTLIATGEIRIFRNTPSGEYMGMFDGKSRDDFGEVVDDDDIARICNSSDYVVDMNNWFEVISNDGDDELLSDTVTADYSEAFDILIDCELIYKEGEQ